MDDPGTVIEASRVAVVGDVAGHLDELRTELARLGAAADGRLPAGLVVVQVGDLVHRGPDSPGVIALVDRYLREQPDQWVQLAGNHEAQYLRAPAFEWAEKLDGAAVAALRRWWAEGRMQAAAAITGPDERFLVTHAGLTAGFWDRVLGAVPAPELAAAALNSFIGSHEEVLMNAGQMLGGGRPDPLAGPMWAAAGTELVPGWLDRPLPFSQLHGHSTVAAAAAARRDRRTLARVLGLTSTDPDTRHETTRLDGGRIIGVDPGHARRPRYPWRAWELPGPATVRV